MLTPNHQAALSRIFNAAVLGYLATQFLRTWRDPMSVEEGQWVRYGVGLILIEFLMVHSGPMFGQLAAKKESHKEKLKVILGLSGFYSLFAIGMALSVKSLEVYITFWLLMLGRGASAWQSGQAKEREILTQMDWAFGVIAYLLCVFASVFLPLPYWGIHPSLGQELLGSEGGGIWEDEPHRAIAAGLFYFTCCTLVQLKLAQLEMRTEA